MARSNTRTGLIAAGAAVAMVGLAYASVPLYQLFCQVTGFGGTTMFASESDVPAKPLEQTISVRFDANVAPGLSWSFKPVKTHETVKIGERRLAFYRATNHSDKPITGTASYNVSPDTAGSFFVKIACFCFTEQTLQPGQTVDMPVTYFVDPAIADDPDGHRIDEITLSYTFFPVDTPTASGQKAVKTAQAKPAPNQG
ncbi:cytochrome c oxidase assembly protein [Sphingoaurantiacus capsulatus]|uniref:Cytochrome c oxidase assembly protein CtaG n=1 Tax=Sphingoaurantiacus capsulatus TaxID=1771310 RepID=A0ABV7X6U6_9SPHN